MSAVQHFCLAFWIAAQTAFGYQFTGQFPLPIPHAQATVVQTQSGPTIQTATVATIPQAVRLNGDYEFPVADPIPVTSGGTVTVNIALADKLSVGLHLDWNTYVSTDGGQTWQFVNGAGWDSYGPAGLVLHLPDGTDLINPDPVLGVPLVNHAGQLLKTELVLARPATAGLTIAVQ